MSDQAFRHRPALARRDFLKRMFAMIFAADIVATGHILGAPAKASPTGFGRGRYGTGKYGKRAKGSAS